MIEESPLIDEETLSLPTRQLRPAKAPRPKWPHKPRAVLPPPVRTPLLKDLPVSDNEELEEEPERPPQPERKYSGIVLDILRELEDIDAKWGLGTNITAKQAKPAKAKFRDEEPDKAPTAQSTQKLLKTYSYARFASKFNRQTSKRPSFNVDEMKLFDSAMNRFQSTAQLRPGAGRRGLYRGLKPVTETAPQSKVSALKKQYETTRDMKYRLGEGQKLLSRAISTEALTQRQRQAKKRPKVLPSLSVARLK